MEYSDIAAMEAVPESTAKVLGYRKIFGRREIEVNEVPSQHSACVVRSSEPGVLGMALRRSNVIGVMIKDNELIRRTVEEAAEAEKALFLSAHELTCVETRERLRNLYRMRSLLSFAMRTGAEVRLVSLAQEDSCLLSAMQLVELARFLGAGEAHAKEMVRWMGGFL